MNDELKMYIENTQKPWWILFYRALWEQLPKLSNSKILDFGSGLGITANHFASNNEVIAIEPNVEMLQERICENSYHQIIGNIEQLKELQDNSFDAVMCHNVLEYAEGRKEIFKEFLRVLKPNGIISIVKHNHNGRIMQKIAFENNLEQAISLLNGGENSAAFFGQINYYDFDDMADWIDGKNISIEKVLGIRTFYALNASINEIRFDTVWQDKMFELEMKASDIDDFKNISFFNHILIRKHS